eukprot:CAMPEP_0182875620 /NCGR_PEP_ID=MMETSP0034_2-20130328/13651_1 /TAXON_ID=156128 /ORGANISM="Nephroselmis pyriformis, Strain CCMP717" /LENGTH=142 /DNA_ID=CAMNT_0025008367 /DNA_START=156 /DNA_END=580 /DNA_ORIENTATION=-
MVLKVGSPVPQRMALSQSSFVSADSEGDDDGVYIVDGMDLTPMSAEEKLVEQEKRRRRKEEKAKSRLSARSGNPSGRKQKKEEENALYLKNLALAAAVHPQAEAAPKEKESGDKEAADYLEQLARAERRESRSFVDPHMLEG